LFVSRTHDFKGRVDDLPGSFLEEITPDAAIQRTTLEERSQILFRAEAMVVLPLGFHNASSSSDLFLQSWGNNLIETRCLVQCTEIMALIKLWVYPVTISAQNTLYSKTRDIVGQRIARRVGII